MKNKEKQLQGLEACGTGKVKKFWESDFEKLDEVVFRWFMSKRIIMALFAISNSLLSRTFGLIP